MEKNQNDLLRRPLYLYDLPEEVLSSLVLKADADAETQEIPVPATADEQTPASEDAVGSQACSLCRLSFTSVQEQRGHLKSDFHHYNLKQKLRGSEPVTESEFEKLIGDLDESLSGSEGSESDEDENEGARKDTTLTALLKKQATLADKSIATAGIEKFQDADVDVVPQLTRLKEAGADVLFMVANVAPSSQVVKSLDRMGWNVPIVSHWGPSGGRFSELAGKSGERVHFIQTFSFSGKMSPKAESVFSALKAKYPEIKTLADVTPAVGIANAYDAMHLTALAIAKAGSTEGPKIREAFYAIDTYDGLIKSYSKPFTPANQDALSSDDYLFTYFKEGEILPLTN